MLRSLKEKQLKRTLPALPFRNRLALHKKSYAPSKNNFSPFPAPNVSNISILIQLRYSYDLSLAARLKVKAYYDFFGYAKCKKIVVRLHMELTASYK